MDDARAGRLPSPHRSRGGAVGWLAAILTACAGATHEPPVAPTQAPPGMAGRAAATLSEAIRIVTVNPPGDELPLAELFSARLRAAGIETEVIVTPSGGSRIGRAAVWGRVPGRRRGAHPIVLLSHLDVVPAETEGWEGEPFDGRIADGYVHGRGAIDAKGVAVIHLEVLTELAGRRKPLDRDVIFLSVPDEENGGWYGIGYLLREHPQLFRNAYYVLTEGGGVRVPADGKMNVWGVAISEKNPCWLRVVATGTPGHSAVPPRDAAVPRLIAALDLLQRLDTGIEVVPEVAAMFAALADAAPPEDRAGFADLKAALANDPAFRSRFLANRQYKALVSPTLTPTVLEGSSRTNVIPQSAAAHLDVRLLPGSSCASFATRLRSELADPGIAIETILSFPSRTSSSDTPLFRAIENVARRIDPDAIVVPRVIAGSSDAHYLREHDMVVYGFVPHWRRTGEPWEVHGPGERISIENLERGITTTLDILEELDRLDAEAARTAK